MTAGHIKNYLRDGEIRELRERLSKSMDIPEEQAGAILTDQDKNMGLYLEAFKLAQRARKQLTLNERIAVSKVFARELLK